MTLTTHCNPFTALALTARCLRRCARRRDKTLRRHKRSWRSCRRTLLTESKKHTGGVRTLVAIWLHSKLESLSRMHTELYDAGIRSGTEQGKEIVDALVSQSRENLRMRMSDYRTRKAEWEKRLALIQVGRLGLVNSTLPRATAVLTCFGFVSTGRWPSDYCRHSCAMNTRCLLGIELHQG